eukprot:326617_1
MSLLRLAFLWTIIAQYTYSETVNCLEKADCECEEDSTCVLKCLYEGYCKDSTVDLACSSTYTSQACTVKCFGESACGDADITAFGSGKFTVKCMGKDACKGAGTITCGTGPCIIYCDDTGTGGSACKDKTIIADDASSFQCIGPGCYFGNMPNAFSPEPTSHPTTVDPTAAPTTADPTVAPITASPTTADPTVAPITADPTVAPITADPTVAPITASPTTAVPTVAPNTADPTVAPNTASPTTADPTTAPTTAEPSAAPTTGEPSAAPTTGEPSAAPTNVLLTFSEIFDVCEEAIESMESVESIESDSDDDTDPGDVLLAYCSLSCEIEDVCVTDAAMAQIEAGTLTDCSCAILECNADCAMVARDGNALSTLIAFTLVISTLLWI